MREYIEQTLLGELTFGFELEGYYSPNDDKEVKRIINKYYQVEDDDEDIELGRDGSIYPRTDEGEKSDCYECGGTGHLDCEECQATGFVNGKKCGNCNGVGQVSCDSCNGVGQVSCDSCNGHGEEVYDRYEDDDYSERTFEWPSPVLRVNPKEITNMIKFLKEITTVINTNSSCGFHIHFGLPYKYTLSQNRFWVLAQLSLDNNMLSRIVKYKRIDMYSGEYASKSLLSMLRAKLKRMYTVKNVTHMDLIKSFKPFFTTEKFMVLRQHPQGTLEWRGPRGFLDAGDNRTIEGFIKDVFVPFAQWLVKAIDNEEINVGNVKITKREIDEVFKNMKYLNTDMKGLETPKFMSKIDTLNQDMTLIPKILKLVPNIKNISLWNAVITISPENKLIVSNAEMSLGFSIAHNSFFPDGTTFIDCEIVCNKTLSVISGQNIMGGFVNGRYKNCTFSNDVSISRDCIFDDCTFIGIKSDFIIATSILNNCIIKDSLLVTKEQSDILITSKFGMIIKKEVIGGN